MNKLLYLILLLSFSCSCAEKKSPPKEIIKAERIISSKTDTLKFTSGVSSIFHDSKGNYWIGSQAEGVAIFDGESYKYFTSDDGLYSNQVYNIQEDTNGNIWFEAAKGISSYNGIKITKHPLVEKENNEWKKTDKDLWFSARNKLGVYRYDGQELTFLAFPIPKIINQDNVYFVTGMSKGKNDMLWIATYAGVFGYDGKAFDIINDETLGLKRETGELHIRSILADSKSRLWIGNNGIGVLLKENDTIINFSEKNNLMHPNSSIRTTLKRGDKSFPGTLEHIFAMEEDGDGNIWFGDRDTGVWKYDGESFKNYTKDIGIPNDFVHTIYKDNKNELWFILTNGSVLKFNGKTFDQQF